MKTTVLLLAMLMWSTTAHAVEVYLAPVDTVTINGEQRFRARCFGMPGAQSIDLRPNGAVASGYMLCKSDTLPENMTGVVSIANALNGTVSPVVKNLIRIAIGASNVNELSASTFDQFVFQLLIDLPNAKPGLWKSLRPSKDGKYHIHFGQDFQQTAWLYPYLFDHGLVADAQNLMLAAIEPKLAMAASFLESWNVADNGTLNGDLTWTKVTGTGGGVVSNQASFSGTGTAVLARAESYTDTSDQVIGYTLVSIDRGSGVDVTMSVVGRKDDTSTATFYACESVHSATPQHYLYKRVAGSRTDIANSGTDPASGDGIVMLLNGSSISCDRNGSSLLGPTTDISIATGTRGGIRYNGSDATSSAVVDAFVIADTSTLGFGPLRRRAM